MSFFVDDIQACEPQHLPIQDGVQVVIADDTDSMGMPRATISADDPAKLIDYVWQEFGCSDPDWFTVYVLKRIERDENGNKIVPGIFRTEWNEDETEILLVPYTDPIERRHDELVLRYYAIANDYSLIKGDCGIKISREEAKWLAGELMEGFA